MYCCCLVTKLCSTLATPWKVARQTSLSICVCIYIYIFPANISQLHKS